jgi:hypothetical protein
MNAHVTPLPAHLVAVGTYGSESERALYAAVVERNAVIEHLTRARAEAVPGLSERQARLLDAIRMHGGEWATARVLALYALTDPGVVQRGTARRDLAALHRAGHLVLVDGPGNRHYVLNTRKDGRS